MNTPEARAVFEALRQVVDPELDINIVDLGLVRRVEFDPDDGRVEIGLTLTSPMCPLGPQLLDAVRKRALTVQGIRGCQVDLVWSPPWDPRQDATEEGKAALGIWD